MRLQTCSKLSRPCACRAHQLFSSRLSFTAQHRHKSNSGSLALGFRSVCSLYRLHSHSFPHKDKYYMHKCGLGFSYGNHINVLTNAFQCNVISGVHNIGRLFHCLSEILNANYFSYSLNIFLSGFPSRQSSGTVIKNRYVYYTAHTNPLGLH